MLKLPSLCALLPLLLGACAPAHVVAERGRGHIVGMDAASLQACAGIPTRSKQLAPGTELYSYEIKNERTTGVDVTLPIIGGGFSVGGAGSYCHALVRLVGGRVQDVIYTGDNDEMIGREGVCAPIFRGCLRASESHSRAAVAGS